MNPEKVEQKAIPIMGAVAAFIVGLVIGAQTMLVSANERYELKTDHDKDQTRLEGALQNINDKLDNILQRGER